MFVTRSVEKVISTCPYAPKKDANSNQVDLRVKRARDSSDRDPCTNLPVQRKSCLSRKQIVYVWAFCMPKHVGRIHGGANSSQAREKSDAGFIAS